MGHHEYDLGPDFAEGGTGSPGRPVVIKRGGVTVIQDTYKDRDGKTRPVEYVNSPEAEALKSLGNLSEFERSLMRLLMADNVEEVVRGVVSVTKSRDFKEALERIFATMREYYEKWYKDDETEWVYLTHYELSDEVRTAALKFCTRLPRQFADDVVDVIMHLPYENYPLHKAGYNREERLEIAKAMANRGSKIAQGYVEGKRTF